MVVYVASHGQGYGGNAVCATEEVAKQWIKAAILKHQNVTIEKPDEWNGWEWWRDKETGELCFGGSEQPNDELGRVAEATIQKMEVLEALTAEVLAKLPVGEVLI